MPLTHLIFVESSTIFVGGMYAKIAARISVGSSGRWHRELVFDVEIIISSAWRMPTSRLLLADAVDTGSR